MALTILDTVDLAVSMGLPPSELDTDPRAVQIVDLTNGLITEKWANPVDPVPTSVLTVALDIAGRAWASTPGKGAMESITRTTDGTSRTERFATGSRDTTARRRLSVYITDDEFADLNPRPKRRRRSIRTPIGY